MEGGPYFLSVDGGTESVRAAVVDRNGRIVSKADSPYPTRFPANGWAEQDPADWLSGLTGAVTRCLAKGGFNGSDIAAVATDATMCTLLPIDGSGTPLSPAILWMDVRASDEASAIFATGHRALSFSPTGCAAEWMLPKALWLASHRPDIYERTRWFIEYQDWLTYRLTGRLALNMNTITQRWLYNRREWRWPTDLYEELGLPDLAIRLIPDIIPLGEPAGSVTAEAARLLGLLQGTPVIQGGGDAPVAMLGLNICDEGAIGIVTGSSNVISGFSKSPLHREGLLGSFPDAVLPGMELVEAGQASTGSVLSWFRRLVLPDLDAADGYEILDREAAAFSPGADGVISMDSFQGNRSPFTDSRLRGAIWGLSLGSTRGQIFRSLMEGIVFGTALILDTFRNAGYPVERLAACGGHTKSGLLMQIYADVCGAPISIVEEQDAPLVGCAAAAAAGIGLYRSLEEASGAMVRIGRTVEPDPDRHESFRPFYGLYRDSHQSLSDLMHRAADLGRG